MTQRNDGRGEINSLQNHFTAYLTVAVRRCKSRYLEDLRKLAVYEPSYDFQETPLDSTEEPDLLSGLPLMDTIENKAIYRALKSMVPRDLEVCGHAHRERGAIVSRKRAQFDLIDSVERLEAEFALRPLVNGNHLSRPDNFAAAEQERAAPYFDWSQGNSRHADSLHSRFHF